MRIRDWSSDVCSSDLVIIDLEDAVEHDVKDTARQHVSDFAKAHPQTSFLVRVNGATTPWFADDLAMCTRFSAISGILLPKAESAQQIGQAAATDRKSTRLNSSH